MKTFKCSKYALPLGNKTYIMGILNVTPDSFSDGGKYFDCNSALEHASSMIEDGADIIDIGAVSTRPYSQDVSEDEEWKRLQYIVPELVKHFSIPISIDTYNVSTAEKCLDCGADIINDVSGIFNNKMAEIVKKYNAGWILMHGGIKISKAEDFIVYSGGIVRCVNEFFDEMLNKTKAADINPEFVCLDPGFGFAKDVEQNSELLKNAEKLKHGKSALLCALSKKRFVGALSNAQNTDDRVAGTLAANLIAVEKGADIVRVHDVKCHNQALSLFDAICR